MKYFAILVLSVWTCLAVVLTSRAQSLTKIYAFNNTNGANPRASLTLGSDGIFYGSTSSGGSSGVGTIFKVTTNGLLTTLVDFNGTNGSSPAAALTSGPDGNFYGTTAGGGSSSNGTVFQMTIDGTLTTLVSFNGTNGSGPQGALTLGPDGNFYGTTDSGGSNGYGTVFKMTTNGTLTSLASFNIPYANPTAGLTLGPDGNFYGTTSGGNTGYAGGVFKLSINGGLKNLSGFSPNSTGANPYGGLTLGPDGNFYGATFEGPGGGGTVFKVTTNGTLTHLANLGYNSDAGLALGPDGNYYGSTFDGGVRSDGFLFKVTTNGTLTTLASLGGTNGAQPRASLTLGPDGNFYGTATYTNTGSPSGYGTIFRLNLPPDFITSPPASQSVVIGSTATFGCQPFGTAPFAYQWLSNGIPISGATNNSYAVKNVFLQTDTNAQFEVVVTNSLGSITSSPASFNILLEPNVYSVSNNGAGNFTVYLASLPNTTNRLWATTNVSLNQWQVIATNVTDSNGLAQFVDTNTVAVPQKFYRLSYP